MFHGPFLVVADRIDRLYDYCCEQKIGWQFDPMYTRMIPAHYLIEIDQIGCPDPAPRYHRFFHPTVGQGSTDVDEMGALYVAAAYAALKGWIASLPKEEPIALAFSGGIDSTSVLILARHALQELGDDPNRLRAFTLDLGGGKDAAQAEAVVRDLQHIAKRPDIIGFDRVVKIDTTHVESVAPMAIDIISEPVEQPFFLSVGFFETHRDWLGPSSVRDALYSTPPPNLPDRPETRRDMAAYKASARSLDHGVGMVLEALDEQGLADDTLIIFTTDHGLAFPGSKATLFDRGLGVMLVLPGPGGFSGGQVHDAPVSHLDIYPTVCQLAGIPPPAFLQVHSLLPLFRGEPTALRDTLFAQTTSH